MSERGSKILTVSTGQEEGTLILQIATEPLPPADNAVVPLIDPEDGLALSACQGIVQEHRGQISYQPREDGVTLCA